MEYISERDIRNRTAKQRALRYINHNKTSPPITILPEQASVLPTSSEIGYKYNCPCGHKDESEPNDGWIYAVLIDNTGLTNCNWCGEKLS